MKNTEEQIKNKTIWLIYPDEAVRGILNRRRDVHVIKRLYVPLGILILSTMLSKKGYNVRLIDERLHINIEDVIPEIIASNPIFVGITSMTGPQIKNGLNISKIIKSKSTHIPIVWGGIHPTLFPEQTLSHPAVDLVCTFEGESSIVEIADALIGNRDLRAIRGILYKDEQGRIHGNEAKTTVFDLNLTPQLDWSSLEIGLNKYQYPYLASILTSRGCPYNCAYCYKNGLDSSTKMSGWRGYSAKHVIEEMTRLNRTYGINIFEMLDENFLTDKNRAIEIFRFMKDNNFTFQVVRSNFHDLKPDILPFLEGITWFVAYSPESASSKIKSYLNKSSSKDKIKQVNKALRDIGIHTAHNMISGFPFEDIGDLKETVDFSKELRDINPYARISMYQYIPYPGSSLYKLMIDKYGFVPPQNLEDWAMTDLYGDIAKCFRPWFKPEDYEFYNSFQLIFNRTFNDYSPIDNDIMAMINNNKKLRYIFGDVSTVPNPTEKLYNPLNEMIYTENPGILESVPSLTLPKQKL